MSKQWNSFTKLGFVMLAKNNKCTSFTHSATNTAHLGPTAIHILPWASVSFSTPIEADISISLSTGRLWAVKRLSLAFGQHQSRSCTLDVDFFRLVQRLPKIALSL
ncbi:hypothetical protein T10_3630 [Trichinella papuae]|uniref:Uncharacterized protein n=1 Tax=Trichinella papuae TaxID=268474 RepID=A0A0V1MWA5_9BILA|nr:hypothetical protein T10_3630 [Trichinella papuae]